MDTKQKIEKAYISFTSKSASRIKSIGYRIVEENKDLKIFKRTILGKKVIASYDTSLLAINPMKKDKLYYYPDIHSCYHKTIKFKEEVFPGLISGSRIDQCMLLPYMRELGEGRIAKAIRIVVVTDKCQVFHNCPARRKDCDGISVYNDDIRFEESAIWDMPNRKYPSMSTTDDDVEKYYPYLPQSAYEYHPILNTDSKFNDIYGNGGFGKSHKAIVNGKETKVSRFYFPKRIAMANSFHHIGGEEPDYKMNIVGTYRANNGGTGARTVIFATTDGGRNWFAKYEFGDMGTYEFSQGVADWRKGYGNALQLDKNVDDNTIFKIRKRTIVTPTSEDKEPIDFFKWSDDINVDSIVNGKETITLTTKNAHNLETGNVIAILSNTEHPLCNNSISSTSGGNGTLYKVNVIDTRTIELYEYIHSSYNPICCRHIHQINRVKDGWLIGTGEIYPNGWMLYFQMKEADSYSEKHAWEEFEIFRLNSTRESVQRTLGAILLDDENQTLIYASDHDTLERQRINVPQGRNMSIRRGSTGVYMGKLCDIDDRNKYNVIYDATEPSFMFKRIHNNLIFAGQRGELAISKDMGKSWSTHRIDTDTFDYHGTFISMFVLGDYIVEFK